MKFSKSFQGGFQSKEDSDIDITPMLDVVFIMLIFFVVTASFVKESGIALNSPAISEPNMQLSTPIIVEVTSDNRILIQGREVSEYSVQHTIVRLKAEKPDSSVVVKVDSQAKTGAVVNAVDGIRAANVLLPSVSITTT